MPNIVKDTSDLIDLIDDISENGVLYNSILVSLDIVKGTLMQIWNSPYMLVFLSKQYTENFVFLTIRFLEFSTRKVYEMFVYKHKETSETLE